MAQVKVRLSISPDRLTDVAEDEIPNLRAEGYLAEDQTGGFLDPKPAPATKAPAAGKGTDL